MIAHTPNLPALIADLPGDDTRAPQTEFTRARQVRFLENLSLNGSVRSAAAAGGVSHQTAYRARRATREFRLAWDAALLAARAHAEQVLAARAIDGVEEKVFYHGEQVDTRIRYSDRLLLAHLGRLDRLVGDARTHAVAEDFDAALARFAAGEAMLADEPELGPEREAPGGVNFSPGPCNTRSMSRAAAEEDGEPGAEAEELDHEDPDGGDWDGGVDWDDAQAAEAELARIEAAMAADRPADAPRLTGTGPDGTPLDPDGLIADAQWQAFEQGVRRWWLVVPPVPEPGARDGEEGGEWCYADPALIAAAESAAAATEGDDLEDDPEARDDEGWDDEREDDWEEDEDEDEDEDGADGEVGDTAAGGEPAGGPSPEASPEPQPASAPSPSPRLQAASRWTYTGLPINDGRCQPYYGRGW